MTWTDRRGLPLSTQSARAATLYREGVDLMLAAWPGAGEALDAAIAEDPDFAMAHAARARLHAVSAESALARARMAEAERLATARADAREASHIAVLALSVAGRAGPALEAVLSHVEAWPSDAMILGMPLGAFGLFAFSGMADHDQARVDLCARHAHAYPADDWWFQSSQGWSRVENGDVAGGLGQLEAAYDLHPMNANTVHALCHARHEAGEGGAALALLEGWLPGYDRGGILHGHLSWHGAVTMLERGDAAGALDLYLAAIRPGVARGVPINVVSDAAAFLWRLEAYGHAAPAGLWDEAAAYGAARFAQAGHPFIDLHMALIEAAVGRREALNARAAALDAMVAQGALAAGPAAPAICRAALAFADGDYAGCADLLAPLAAEVVRVGGSGAQRELVDDMLVLAQMRDGRAGAARAALGRRLARRPSRRDADWLQALG